ncbi:MAG: ABC transporter ATP-binding protein [Armatimonadota bacterium]
MTKPVLLADGLVGGYGGHNILRGVSLSLYPGEFLGIVGPNGSGKSTLLRALNGLLPLKGGSVMLAGRPLAEYTPRQQAAWIGTVPQISVPVFAFTVREVVEMGRHPHASRLNRPGGRDAEIVDRAIKLTDIAHLQDRTIDNLSSGELQRVTIARALAQEPRILLLDEPTAHLDIGHQMDIFNLLTRLSIEQNLAVLCVSHDLNLAAEYCRRLLLFSVGRIYVEGSPREVITEENLSAVYGTLVSVQSNPHSGQPMVLINRAYTPEEEL